MKLLDAKKLSDLAAALHAKGYRVVAPILDGDDVRLKEWSAGAVLRPDVIPVNSVKDFLMPKTDVIGRYAIEGNDFAPKDVPISAPKTVLLAVRSCDAAALKMLDTVFNWDYKDAFYNARRAATTVVTLVCSASDDQCFCTTVGGAPDSTAGADAVLRPADGGAKFIVESLDEKGKAVLDAAGAVLSDGTAKADPPAKVAAKFDLKALQTWLSNPENFESDLWEAVSLACLGCGACAYMCPSCHCFDIQDEATRTESVRVRTWDACGLGLFTLHTSGHNPRATQAARWRQRVMHKFAYAPERFQIVACSGCGRCGRLCGAGMAISEVCHQIAQAREAVRK